MFIMIMAIVIENMAITNVAIIAIAEAFLNF